MKKTKRIGKLPNGNYVKNWQYSQGYFDVVETSDIFEACDITVENFNTFFKKNDMEFLTVEYVATII